MSRAIAGRNRVMSPLPRPVDKRAPVGKNGGMLRAALLLSLAAAGMVARAQADVPVAAQPAGDRSGAVLFQEDRAGLERAFDAAVEAGDRVRARAIDRELSARAGRQAAPAHGSGPEMSDVRDWRRPAGGAIDTGLVTAFGAATDAAGVIWVAAAFTDARVRVYRSTDLGADWEAVLEFSHSADVPKVEVVCAEGESSFVYVFYLAWVGEGDLWAMRFAPDSLMPVALPVRVGPDTVSDFGVTADRDPDYYLYCLYSNEARAGLNGGFTRSLDFGRTWEAPQDWWNCQDPHVACATGASVHCVWRYAATGRQIHHQVSRYYGRPARWRGYARIDYGEEACWDPCVAQADTQPESRSPVWVAYTRAARDTTRQDIGHAYSPDGGFSWAGRVATGRSDRDEWFPDIGTRFGTSGGCADLVWQAGDKGTVGKTGVYRQCVNTAMPGVWSEPVLVTDRRVNAACEAARARVVFPGNPPRNRPGIVFSGFNDTRGDGLYYQDARNEPAPGTSNLSSLVRAESRADGDIDFALDVTAPGRYRARVYDAAGRRLATVFDGLLAPGRRRLTWRPAHAAQGSCFLVVDGPGVSGRARFTVCR